MNNSSNEIRQQSKAFFSAFPWKNLLLFSAFLLLAFVFWIMLFFQRENVEGRFIVPLQFVNLAHDEVFNTTPPDFIEVFFRDEGANIFRYTLSRRDTIVIDVANFRERGVTAIQGPELQYLIGRIFPTGHPFMPNPVSISLETSQLENRELAVVFDGEMLTNRANLVVDSVFFTPATIRAYGSEQALENLEVAATEFLVFRNLRASSQFSIRINPVEGVRFIPDEVEIHIPIKEFTERSIEVPITAINVPDNLSVKFFPARVTASFSVTLENYRHVSADDLEIELDYYDFYANEDGRVSLQLTRQSGMITNVRLSPASVEFLFEYLPTH